MKRATLALLLVLSFTLSFSLLAEENESLPSSSEKGRAETFIMAMVQRKAANDLTAVLEQQGFRKEQIQEVLESPEYASFAKNLAANEKLRDAISDYVEKALNPRLLAQILEKRGQEERIRRQIALASFLQRLAFKRQLHQRKNYKPEKKSFWDKMTTAIGRHLFGEQS